MISYIVHLCTLFFMASSILAEERPPVLKCYIPSPQIPTEWIDLRGDCLNALRRQIQMEVEASYNYLAMGSYFSRDTVNRPGLAEIFFLFAKEEREEASKLIQHLSMNGQLTSEVTNLISLPQVNKDAWQNAWEALEDALKLETEQSKSIRRVIAICEKKYNYYSVVKNLISEFLESQRQDQRNLANKLSTLKKMMQNHGALGEFLFDKDLLNKIYFVTNSF